MKSNEQERENGITAYPLLPLTIFQGGNLMTIHTHDLLKATVSQNDRKYTEVKKAHM
jgi:hypothetical protein